jgi:hypothetical protein
MRDHGTPRIAEADCFVASQSVLPPLATCAFPPTGAVAIADMAYERLDSGPCPPLLKWKKQTSGRV